MSFALLILIGLLAVNGYGVSADEPAMLTFGGETFAWLFQGAALPQAADWNFHGPAVQLLLTIGQKMLGLSDGREIWLFRHFVTFLLFAAAVAAFVALARRRFGQRLALTGAAFLVLSPRLFAHGFYNPKDIPALTLFTIGILTLLRLLERPTAGRLLLHSLVCALLISLRTFGMMVPLFTVGLLLSARRGKTAVAYLLLVTLLLIAVWPRLWADPLGGFLSAFLNSAGRTGGGFYFGHPIIGTPWHYTPVWIAITTPSLYFVLFLIGLSITLVRITQKPANQQPATFLPLLWFLLPLLAIPVFHIGIFDGWRHLFFMYPAFLLLALAGLEWLLLQARGTGLIFVKSIVALSLVFTAFWMVRNHPFQYAYFSLPARPYATLFERDEWGLSYRQGLEWILAHDPRGQITVYGSARIIRANADLLPLSDWERLAFVPPNEADYLLDNFRGHDYREVFPPERELHAITVDGLKLLGIYRGPDDRNAFEAYEW